MPSDNKRSQPSVNRAGAPPEPERRSIGTSGGDYAEGNIDKRQGTFIDYVEGQVIIEEAERAYDVRGLPNPFLGLRSFTYDDHERYAGRERTIEFAVQKLIAPGEQRTLLFITGASGSGKSSFAQAGLLPALEAYYALRGLAARSAVFRPSRHPLAGLADALAQLGLPAGRLILEAVLEKPARLGPFIQHATPSKQINLLIVDQFEELFTQSEPRERDALFAFLERIPAFSELRTHVIATLRADYLPELFERKGLYDSAKQGIDLRAMRETELRETIQRPIQQWYPNADKRFEDALLEKLARDASGDATYLPLLQVTLEDLWDRGSLKLSAYGTLTDAIQRRAEEVYTYADAEEQPRSAADQAAITQIFLDLVEVSLDDDPRRDVRRRRTYDELAHGSPDKQRLIEELCAARLLSKSLETRDNAQVEVVDIIHESLIGNWERLRQATIEQRTILQQRVRFEQALQEWQEKGRSMTYLLTGVRLAEAQELERQGNVALRGVAAQALLRESIARRQAEQQRQVRRARLVAAVLAVLLLAALAASIYAVNRQSFAEARRAEADQQRQIAQTQEAQANQQRQLAQQQQAQAERQARISRAQALAANAVAQLEQDPERSILLAVEAISTTLRAGEPVVAQAEDALHQALLRPNARVTLRGHKGWVTGAAFSPNGRYIVTASEDGTAKVWDTATGQERLTLQSGGVQSAAFSPDGRSIVTANNDGTAKVWDAATYHERLILRGHADTVYDAVYSSDSHFIITHSADYTTKIWDANTGQERLTLQSGAGTSSLFSPDGRFIVTTSGGSAIVRNATTGKEHLTLHSDELLMTSAAFSPDGRSIVTGAARTAKVWDAETGQERLALNDGSIVSSVAYSPDGHFIVSASFDGTAKVWAAETGQKLLTLHGHASAVYSAYYSSDGHSIVTASADGTAKIWDIAGQERLTLRDESPMPARGAYYSPDGRFIVSVGFYRYAKVWDAATGQKLLTLCCQYKGGTQAAAYSPDGDSIVTVGAGEVKIWNAATGQERLTLIIDEKGVQNAAYSPDGRSIVTANYDGTAKIWDANTGQERLTLRGHNKVVNSANFSPDGSTIVTTSFDGTAKVWDAATGQVRLTLSHTDTVYEAAYSPDGHFIVTASADRTAKVWDATTGQVRLILASGYIVHHVAYSPDGHFIVTASEDGTAKVWDIATGHERLTLLGHEHWVNSVVYSPDGRFILTVDGAGTTRQYVMDINELLRLAQSRVTRQLTPAERVQFGLD